MPEDMWKRDNDGQRHLENDILLAYTRGQLAADVVLIVQQHCAKCTRCTQRCAEYTHIGATLQHHLVYAIPGYPSVVDMLGTALDSPEAAAVALQQREEDRKNRRKQRVSARRQLKPRIGAFPITASVSAVILASLLVYMLTTHVGIQAIRPPVEKKLVTPGSASTVPAQPGVTQTPKVRQNVKPVVPGVTVKATPTPVVTPPPTVGTAKPTIWLCSSSLDLAQSRLRVCGKNFKAGDIVIVLEVLPGINHRTVFATIADAQGSITGAWMIQNCRSIPSAIFAFDVTHAWFTQPVSVNLPVGGCSSVSVKPSHHR